MQRPRRRPHVSLTAGTSQSVRNTGHPQVTTANEQRWNGSSRRSTIRQTAWSWSGWNGSSRRSTIRQTAWSWSGWNGSSRWSTIRQTAWYWSGWNGSSRWSTIRQTAWSWSGWNGSSRWCTIRQTAWSWSGWRFIGRSDGFINSGCACLRSRKASLCACSAVTNSLAHSTRRFNTATEQDPDPVSIHF